jgi:hypothetical protein
VLAAREDGPEPQPDPKRPSKPSSSSLISRSLEQGRAATNAAPSGPRSISASYGDTVLNLVVATGYLSRLIGNPRVSGYLEHHHSEILTEFRAIIDATSLEETGSGASEESAFSS